MTSPSDGFLIQGMPFNMSHPYPGLTLSQFPESVPYYPYHQGKRLDASKSEFRLFVLYPRTSHRTEDLRITFFEDLLDSELSGRIARGFQALSYVWGDASVREHIMVITPMRDMQIISRVSVTMQLAQALVHYPYRDNHVVLWADAICINQEDLKERAEQVQLMHEIYAKADLVTAWLGPEADESNLALNLLTRMGESVEVDLIRHKWWNIETSEWFRRSAKDYGYTSLLLNKDFPLPWDGREARAIEELFYRPWFERLWIRQECILGGDRTVLLCGKSSIMWTNFRKAAYVLAKKRIDDAHPDLSSWRLRLHMVHKIWMHRQQPLHSLMRDLREARCTDDRDRVYGALHILPFDSVGIRTQLQPDYRKSVRHVYRDLVLADRNINGRLDLLVECCLTGSTIQKPTWVPDWSRSPRIPQTVAEGCADGQSSARSQRVLDEEILDVDGLVVATVNCVCKPFLTTEPLLQDTDLSRRDIVHGLKRCIETLDLSKDHPAGDSVLDALAVTLSNGFIAEHFGAELQSDTRSNLGDWRRLLELVTSFDDSDDITVYLADDPAIMSCISSSAPILRQHMFSTAKGYFGFTPAEPQNGDCVAIILGCMRPMLLRPHSTSPDTYTVVGPCGVHGVNWGEALLGPLPPGIRFIWNRSGPRGGIGPAFMDIRSGEESMVDPRIDWELLNVGQDRDKAFVWRTDPVLERTECFRKPDTDYFRSRGLELESLRLR